MNRRRRSGSPRLSDYNPLARRGQRRAREEPNENVHPPNAEPNVELVNGANVDNSNNERNHNSYANLSNNVLDSRRSSYRVFNSRFFQFFSRWPKNRKIEQSATERPKKAYLFRPFVRRLIPVHNGEILVDFCSSLN